MQVLWLPSPNVVNSHVPKVVTWLWIQSEGQSWWSPVISTAVLGIGPRMRSKCLIFLRILANIIYSEFCDRPGRIFRHARSVTAENCC